MAVWLGLLLLGNAVASMIQRDPQRPPAVAVAPAVSLHPAAQAPTSQKVSVAPTAAPRLRAMATVAPATAQPATLGSLQLTAQRFTPSSAGGGNGVYVRVTLLNRGTTPLAYSYAHFRLVGLPSHRVYMARFDANILDTQLLEDSLPADQTATGDLYFAVQGHDRAFVLSADGASTAVTSAGGS